MGPNSTAGIPAARNAAASDAPSRPTLRVSPCTERLTASRSARTYGLVRGTVTGGWMKVRVTSISGIARTSSRISVGSCPGR